MAVIRVGPKQKRQEKKSTHSRQSIFEAGPSVVEVEQGKVHGLVFTAQPRALSHGPFQNP